MSARLNPYGPLAAQEETEDKEHDLVNGWLQSLKAKGNFKIEFVKKSLIGLDLSKQAEFLEDLDFWDRNTYRWWDTEENSTLYLMPHRDRTRCLEQTNSVAAGKSQELSQHLVEKRGWCPSTVTVILEALHIPGLHLSSLVFTNDPSGTCKRKVDLAGHTASFHQRCTRMECFETRYNEEPPCHVAPDCPCTNFEVDASRLDEIIRCGQIPIFSVSLLTGAMKLNVVTASTEYLTISYVWSQFHPLTPCHIRRLLDTIEPEFSTSPNRNIRNFWLDILCVPQDEHQYKDSKRQAIDSIPEVYGGSRIVLVLDDLLLQSKPHESATILGIRILACEWMRRVWTLQEAARATLKFRRLVFCVGHGYKVFDDILEGLAKEPWQLSGMVLEALKARLIFRAGPGKMKSHAVFDRLLTTLTYRGCSFAEDEAPCIAAILRSTLGNETSKQLENIRWCMRGDVEHAPQHQIDIERFVAGKRMTQLFLQLRQFPLSLLFCEGLRVNEAPFRCLPYSFIARSTQLRTRVESKRKFQQAEATCNDREVAFQADADVFTLATRHDIEFNKMHLFICVAPPDRRTRKPVYKQKRIEQTHWDKKLTEQNLLPEDQGWASLRNVKGTEHLALITSDADRRAGIVLKIRNISHLNREDVETDFLCRVFVGEETERDRTASSARGERFLADTQIFDANTDTVTEFPAAGFTAQGSESEEGGGESSDETDFNAGGARFNWRSSGEWQDSSKFSGITARSAYRIRSCCWRIRG